MMLDKITADLSAALKQKDDVATSTLRMVIAGINNARIAKGSGLTDDEVVMEIAKDAKRHKESIEAYESAGRSDLVAKENAELLVLQRYLPEPLSDEELANVVDEAILAIGAASISDIGRVIKAVMSSAGNRADGAKVAEITRRKLGNLPVGPGLKPRSRDEAG